MKETHEHQPCALAGNRKSNHPEPKAPAQRAWKSAVIVKLLSAYSDCFCALWGGNNGTDWLDCAQEFFFFQLQVLFIRPIKSGVHGIQGLLQDGWRNTAAGNTRRLLNNFVWTLAVTTDACVNDPDY